MTGKFPQIQGLLTASGVQRKKKPKDLVPKPVAAPKINLGQGLVRSRS
jgi:hypothetical protein